MSNIKSEIANVTAANFKKIKKIYGFKLDDDIEIQLPKKEEYGDYSTAVSLKIARENDLNPIKICEEIADLFSAGEYDFLEKVEVYKPGFLNFFLSNNYLIKNLEKIYALKEKYGENENKNPDKIIIEFVSANPTGPLNVVSARASTVGDVLAKLFKLNGHNVFKEYYINDAGKQVELLAESLLIRIKQHIGEKIELEEEHYHGEYLKDMAKEIIENDYYDKIKDTDHLLEGLKKYALDKLINSHKNILKKFGVEFDKWFSEEELRNSDSIKKCYDILVSKNITYEKEEKTWFKSTEFGDEKDRVIIRDDKSPTYLMVDIAYHLNKANRGFNKIIDLWGPDHDSHIAQMKRIMKILDYDKDKFNIIVIQQVNLLEKEKKVKMSKRLGTFVLMDELINDIGVDAARFFFLHRSISSHLDFDMDLARKQSDENPAYYVQYAYARICNIFKQAQNKNIEIKYKMNPEHWDLKHEEIKLLKKLLEYPVTIKDAGDRIQPNIIPNYLLDLSTLFHQFYTECQVLNNKDETIIQNRLFLLECTRQILKNGLDLIGVSSPERM